MKEYNISDIPFDASNVFELEEPGSCSCQVWSYDKGHSILTICLFSPKGEIRSFISFEGVSYFQGPMWWHGANFKRSDIDVHVDIKVKTQGKKNEFFREWLKTQNEEVSIGEGVFVVEQEEYKVIIMAGIVYMKEA